MPEERTDAVNRLATIKAPGERSADPLGQSDPLKHVEEVKAAKARALRRSYKDPGRLDRPAHERPNIGLRRRP